MAVYKTSWLVGSVRDLPAQTFQADGVGAQVPAGNYYLASPISALSLIFAFRLALEAAGVSDPVISMTRSRHVRVTAGEPFTVTWGSATRLRDLLGYEADLADLGAHQATRVSPLLWSPGRPGRSDLSPLRTRGIRRPLSYYATSPSDGSTTVVTHGAREFQKLAWLNIDTDRIQTPGEFGGEWVRFFDEVLGAGASLYHIPEVIEDAQTSVFAATLLGGLGPYVFSPSSRSTAWSYDRSRGFEWTDRRADIDLPLHVVPQYQT